MDLQPAALRQPSWRGGHAGAEGALQQAPVSRASSVSFGDRMSTRCRSSEDIGPSSPPQSSTIRFFALLRRLQSFAMCCA